MYCPKAPLTHRIHITRPWALSCSSFSSCTSLYTHSIQRRKPALELPAWCPTLLIRWSIACFIKPLVSLCIVPCVLQKTGRQRSPIMGQLHILPVVKASWACLQTLQAQSLCISNQNSFWINNFHWMSKNYSPLYTSSCCHQGCQDLLCSLTWSNKFCNKLELPCTLWEKRKKLFISLLFGPCHKDCFRHKDCISTRCFLAELQNVLWEARESHFLFMNWSVLEDQSWGTGARMKKFPISVQDFKKHFSTYNQSCV